MKYTKKHFLADVAKEAKALKKNATKDELERLNFEVLDPGSSRACIYGQITGNCMEGRGIHLIEKSCKKFVEIRGIDSIQRDGFIAVRENINGSKMPSKRKRGELVRWLSSIESYIALPNAKNKNLIAYLKGERKDLVL